MFSFHKPKIYRSLKGCCICRAKSSSSRFTDSKRYESDFGKCFWIDETRSGEICNACVLLVKRWKKLPVGSTRNWHHVVDARAGPGTKSILKIKSRNKEAEAEAQLARRPKKKHKHRKIPRHHRPPQSPGGLSDDVIGDDLNSDADHSESERCSSPEASDSDYENTTPQKEYSAKSRRRKQQSKPMRFSSFLDLSYWKETEVCCGIIFKGPNGELLVDTTLLRPCRLCKSPSAPSASAACPTSAGLSLGPPPGAATLMPRALEGVSPPGSPGSPMEAESASSSLSPSGPDSRSSSPRPLSAHTVTPSSLAISTAVSAVLDLSMPVHKDPTAAAAHVLSHTMSHSLSHSMNHSLSHTMSHSMSNAISLSQQHRCIEMEV